MTRMFRRLQRNEAAFGGLMMEHGAEWIEILGYVGVDFAQVDMMNSSIDWGHAAEMVRACARFDVTPCIRLQSYPWGGTDELDPRLPADVFRAIGIGAEGITASVNTAEAIASLMVPINEDNENDYVHTRPYVNRPLYMPRDGTTRSDDDRSGNRWLMPDLESTEAIGNIDEIVDVDGLRAIKLALADISQAIGHPFDYKHPELLAIVREVVTKASQRGIVVFAFAGGDTPDAVTESVRRLWDLGVRGFSIPRLTFAAQRFYERTLQLIDEQLEGART
ncbi:MAG TPA: aldolase/citrate lyase family protein [Solirubrobacteraceae bacterium]|nr:aldolase/citrate lyase family protein [Solirubrobacteraceae bacterium]